MMDHRQFVASLNGADKAVLTERSDRAGLLHLAGHLGAIAICSALILSGNLVNLRRTTPANTTKPPPT